MRWMQKTALLAHAFHVCTPSQLQASQHHDAHDMHMSMSCLQA